MKDNALANVNALLNILGYPSYENGGMEELNNKIKQYQTTTPFLNAELLRAYIIDPAKTTIQDQMAQDVARFNYFLQQTSDDITDVILQIADKIIDEAEEGTNGTQLAAEFYKALDRIDTVTINLTNGTTTVTNKPNYSFDIKKARKLILFQNFDKMFFQMGNYKPNLKPFQALINKDPNFSKKILALAQEKGINVSAIYAKNIQAPIFNMTETNDGLQIYYDIIAPFVDVMDPTKNSSGDLIKAEKAAFNYFESLPNDLRIALTQQLATRATNFFDQFFNSNGLDASRLATLKTHFHNAITKIVTDYPAALFVGNNLNAITGLLGEIQGLYYTYTSLGENPKIDNSKIQQIATWIGGNTEAGGGIKTGADIVIKDLANNLGYGIQVKNSMSIDDPTNFSSFSLGNTDSEFVNQLVNFGIDKSTVLIIQDVLMMQSFNIAYHKEGKTAKPGLSNQGDVVLYTTAYDKLLKLVEKARQYMTIAAAMIMRIQYLQGTNFEQTNTLWLIGGAAAVSAVEIIDKLINQLKNIQTNNSFKTTILTTLEGSEKKYTIIDYLNGLGGAEPSLKTTLNTSYNFH